ncbi:MAG: nucleotidyl transferase AbiEii/AbiGii toxin family protein [Wenzhouxiangellaceae bacterium]
MRLSAASLTQLAEETGFRVEFLEKVDRLLELLQALFNDPFLAERLALKGGTALNLFHFELPRLSVGIDLNYIGALDRDTMLAERPELEQRIRAIAGRQNLTLVRAPTGHAGSKWTFRYTSSLGGSGSLEVDLNYLYRQALWPVERLDSHALGPIHAQGIAVLDLHELAGGKLAALFSRTAARDLFDAHQLLTVMHTDDSRLRQAFVLYGAMNNKDWRTITPEDIEVDPRDARRQLFPLLVQWQLTRPKEQDTLLERMIAETREAVSELLPLKSAEHEFLKQLRDEGNIHLNLLDLDAEQVTSLVEHPALQWRARQARR